MTTIQNVEKVVVGVDGSANSGRALETAAAEARLRGAPLKVVHAYETTRFVVTEPHRDAATLQSAAQEVLDHALAKLPAKEGLDLEGVVIAGEPAQVLIDASDGASLLVVGTRGLGGFTGLLLGSVSTKCVHHAHCPVLVAR